MKQEKINLFAQIETFLKYRYYSINNRIELVENKICSLIVQYSKESVKNLMLELEIYFSTNNEKILALIISEKAKFLLG